jgi:hypothetical protein
MQFLFFVCSSFIVIIIGNSQELSSFQNLNTDLLDGVVDPIPSNNELSWEYANQLDWIGPGLEESFLADDFVNLDSMAESDSRLVFADHIDVDWMIELGSNFDSFNQDPSFSLADDSFCDTNDADYIQSLGKKRRENSCRAPPVGQTEQSDEPKWDFNRFFIEKQSLTLFPEDLEICPPKIFGTSNTPLCKNLVMGQFYSPKGQKWVNLFDVEPRTWMKMIYSLITKFVTNANQTLHRAGTFGSYGLYIWH